MTKGPKPKPIHIRFWPKVDKNGPVPTHRPEIGPCWNWTGALNDDGYGKFSNQDAPGGWELAHRVAWRLQFGPIPKGKHILHKCDNRRCQRGDHYFLGRQKENALDRKRKGRTAIFRGMAHYRTVLTEKDVRDIRSSGQRYSAIAAKYNVTESAVGKIKRRETWRHVS